jgi:hypothetical protein
MAGSLTWLQYVDDLGSPYSWLGDKSLESCLIFALYNGNGTTNQLIEKRSGNWPLLPRGFRMRYAVAHIKGQKHRKHRLIPIGRLSSMQLLTLPSGSINFRTNSDGFVTYAVSRIVGESRLIVPSWEEQI